MWRLRSFPDYVDVTCRTAAERPRLGHEIKHDGFRLLARRGGGRVRLFHPKRPPLQRPLPADRRGEAASCLIDGEAIDYERCCSDQLNPPPKATICQCSNYPSLDHLEQFDGFGVVRRDGRKVTIRDGSVV